MCTQSKIKTKTGNNPHHDLHVSNALKRIVYTTIGHLHQNLLDGFAVVLRVHKLCGTKLFGHLKLCRVEVHTNNPGCPSDLTAHNSSQANGSEAKYGTCRTRLNLWIKSMLIVPECLLSLLLKKKSGRPNSKCTAVIFSCEPWLC